jgi:hypothetical protein
MKFFKWKIWLSLGLIGLSVALYLLNYLIFRDTNYMFRLFLAQLGFLPISVLLVTIIVNQLLAQRTKAAKLAKLNMVIGTFFGEVGTPLLKMISAYDRNLAGFRQEISVLAQWSDLDFANSSPRLVKYHFAMDATAEDLHPLRDFLAAKRNFLLRLLENPNLLEHDSFSNLLLAVFHLSEELSQRRDLSHLAPADQEHLAVDLKRAYSRLIREWLAYMRHLKKNYPYLFSLALRTNPFDPEARPEIK